MTTKKTCSGFTLIETMGVALIAALIAGLVVSAPWGRRHVDDAGLHTVQLIEDRIRETARDGQGLTLRLTRDGWTAMDSHGQRRTDLETDLPNGGRYWDLTGRPLTTFAYDRRGFSLNARVRVFVDGKPRLASLDGIIGEVKP